MKFNATVVNKVVVTCGEASKPGDPITLNANKLKLPSGYASTATESSIDGVSWSVTAAMKNSSGAIQMNKAKDGVLGHLWNTTAFAKPIANVVFTFNSAQTSDAAVLCVEFGTDVIATPGSTYIGWDGNTTMTFTPETADATYFSLSHKNASGAMYVDSIVITFVA